MITRPWRIYLRSKLLEHGRILLRFGTTSSATTLFVISELVQVNGRLESHLVVMSLEGVELSRLRMGHREGDYFQHYGTPEFVE